MLKITEKQGKILTALATYKYLTVSQFVKLGISDETYTRKVLKTLEKRTKPLVKSIKYAVDARLGRLESMFYLAPFGRRVLCEALYIEEKDIKIPKGRAIVAFKDYLHRKSTISFYIALRQWCDLDESLHVEFLDYYFDKIGNARVDKNLRAKNKIGMGGKAYLIPDANFIVVKNGSRSLYLFEMCNGKDTKRIVGQIEQHAIALQVGDASERYDLRNEQGELKSYRILSLFQFKSIRVATMQRLQKDDRYKNISANFLFSDLESIYNTDFFASWHDIQGNIKAII